MKEIKYTPAGKPSKFSTMWHWTNILLNHKNTEDAKLFALGKMESHFDDDTRDHFQMALNQVLREERNPIIRKQAISLLAAYFEWHEIEWTFWLHEKRCKEDIPLLYTYEAYCKRKRFNNDSDTLHTVVMEYAFEVAGVPA